MHTNNRKWWIFQHHNWFCKKQILLVILIVISLEIFEAEEVMHFSSMFKTTEPNLHSLILDCNVSAQPRNLWIYRKFPPSEKPEKKYNPSKDNVLNKTLEIKVDKCIDATGLYECNATYTHRELESQAIKIQTDECKPTLCYNKTNNKVIQVTQEPAQVKFCVVRKDSIDKILLNENLLFDKVLISSPENQKYVLFNTTKESEINFKLFVHQINKVSRQDYLVKIISVSNLTLEYRFSLVPQKENPVFCDQTHNNTNITAVTNKANVELCVKQGKDISYTLIYDTNISDHGLIDTFMYTSLNRTDGDKIYFTIQLLNLTRASPDKYFVKFITSSGAHLVYQFNVKLNELIDASDDCNTTENYSTLQVTKNNTVIVMLCLNITDVISNVMIDGLQDNDTFLGYMITNISKGNNTQFIVEFWSLKNGPYRNVSIYVTNNSASNKAYTWYLLFPKEQTDNPTAPTNSIAILIPIIGLMLFLLIITIIIFLRFKSKSMKRRQRYGQAYDNVTYKSSENMLRPSPLSAYQGSSQTPGRSLGPPTGQEEENLYSPQGTDHYVNDDGLIYVVMGDIEKRKSTASVKANKQRVQYLEIDFTKTGKIKITEAETDNPTEAQLTTAADVEQVTLTTAGQINETEADNQKLFVSKV